MDQAAFSSTENAGFEGFLLSEHRIIAEAHFKTTETISAFLKHYLTIISAPIAILGVVVSIGWGQAADYRLISSVGIVVALLFLVVSSVGITVLAYVVNLRMDALLYAHVVNGIRKYFYDQECRLGIATKSKLRVLPQSPQHPPYYEPWFFGPVVLVFACLNTAYFYPGSAGLAYYRGITEPFENPIVALLTALFFAGHFYLYLRYACYREYRYLRSSVLGVDIDGVINRHRNQFCRLLYAKSGKQVDPQELSTVPVHECRGLGITRRDEKLVFNDPVYWIEMPAMEGAADTLRKLRNSMGLKIHLFTHRPWPVTVGLSNKDKRLINYEWADASKTYAREVRQDTSWQSRPLSWFKSFRQVLPYRALRLRALFRTGDYVDRITRAWLEEHGFQYDQIMIEKGSEEVADPSSHIVNRFSACRLKSVRYFVEDNLANAKKLAFICDVVFLVDQPYNQTDRLPANIIRISSWDEVLKHMREIW